MSFAFLQVDGDSAVARTPLEHAAGEAGARFEVRDGWNVAVSYGSPNTEAVACIETAGWADVSHLGKLEIQGPAQALGSIVANAADGAALELGTATPAADAWWCPLTARRALVICDRPATAPLRERLVEAAAAAGGASSVLDVSTVFAAMTLIGPLAREVFARFCAIDLRPAATPVSALRPGSIARQPGLIVREDEERFLFVFGWGIGHYMWSQVADAGGHLGARPVGLDALAAIPEPVHEVSSHA